MVSETLGLALPGGGLELIALGRHATKAQFAVDIAAAKLLDDRLGGISRGNIRSLRGVGADRLLLGRGSVGIDAVGQH